MIPLLTPHEAARVLVAAHTLLRTGEFDENQPRDEDGKWTDGGSNPGFLADNVVRNDDSVTEQMALRHDEARENGQQFFSEEVDESTSRSFQFYRGGSHGSYNANVNTPGYSRADDVAEIQKAILESGYNDQRGVLTYRGLTADMDKALEKFKPGETIELDGFQSTSFSVEKAAQFLGSSGAVTGSMHLDRGTMLEIVAVRGMHLGSEDEFLLPHGSQFKVLGVKEVEIEVRARSYDNFAGQRLTRKVIQLQQVDRDEYPTGKVAEESDEDNDEDNDDN